MIKTLKITSMLTAATAVIFVLFLVGFGLRGDPKIEEFLKAPGAIEKFKQRAEKQSRPTDQISPLVKQAMAFALRLNPPKPKPPKPKKEKPKVVKKVERPREIPKPKTPVSTKFNLVATVRYDLYPEKSLALLDLTAKKNNKWYRQGEQVGHLTIHQINDGSIVLFQNGKYNSEILVPKPKKTIRSLLKSEADDSKQPPSTTKPPFYGQTILTQPERKAQPSTESRDKSKPSQNLRKLPRRSQRTQKRRKPPPAPTPEQKEKTLAKSIAEIKNIMTEQDNFKTNEERAEEMGGWIKLLEKLEEERAKVKNLLEQKSPETDKTPDKTQK